MKDDHLAFPMLLSCFLLFAIWGCGGHVGSMSPPPPSAGEPGGLSLTISPHAATIYASRALHFTSNQVVTWSVNGIPGGNPDVGTISSSGLYTAPKSIPRPSSIIITATSVADRTQKSFLNLAVVTAPGVIVNYGYDQTGERVFSDNGTTTTIYPTKLYNAEGTTTTKHIFANGILLATIHGSGKFASLSIVNTDHLTGSNIVSDMQGNIQEVMDYYPFGDPRLDEQQGFSEQRQFTGHEFDQDTGLSYMDARYYAPNAGRFLSEDPAALVVPEGFLVDPQQLNLYSYARNNPVTLKDPTGRCADGVTTIACVAAVASLVTIVSGIVVESVGAFKNDTNLIVTGDHLKNTGIVGGLGVLGKNGIAGEPYSDVGPFVAEVPSGRLQEIEESNNARIQSEINRLQADASVRLYGSSGNYIPEIEINSLPQNVQDSFRVYQQNGWQKIPGRETKPYYNREGYLPSGQSYQEFDVNPQTGPTRDAERFFVSRNDKSVYYTDTHTDPSKGTIVSKIK